MWSVSYLLVFTHNSATVICEVVVVLVALLDRVTRNMSIVAATTTATALYCRSLRGLSSSPAMRTILAQSRRWDNPPSQLSSRASFFWSSPQSEADTVSPSSASASPSSSSSSTATTATATTTSSSSPVKDASNKSNDKLITKDLVQIISESHDLSLAESRRIFDTIFDTIVDVRMVVV